MPLDDRAGGPRRLRVAVVLSVAFHVLLFAAIVFLVRVPLVKDTARKGEPMMVELQNPEMPAPRGNPASRVPVPPGPASPSPRPSRAQPPQPQSKPAAKPSPPAPKPAPPAVAKPTPPEPTPPKPEPAAVARATPAVPESPDGPRKSAESAPRPQEEATKPAPEPPRTAHADAAATSKAEEARAATPAARPQVDIRSALRGGGGAGGGGPVGSSTGRVGGRGGIEGEPIPLDSKDPRYTDFLERVRRAIYAKWGYPCVKSAVTRECEYKSAQLIIEFGILKNGTLQFIELRDTSGLPIYDDYALNAIKFAAPFPEVPPSMMIAMRQGSTGIAILARFSYVLTTSIENVLR